MIPSLLALDHPVLVVVVPALVVGLLQASIDMLVLCVSISPVSITRYYYHSPSLFPIIYVAHTLSVSFATFRDLLCLTSALLRRHTNEIQTLFPFSIVWDRLGYEAAVLPIK